MKSNFLRFQDIWNKIKKFFSHNLLLKVISLLIATILWLAVVNYQNPEVMITVNADIEVRNDEELTKADQTYSLDQSKVSITYHVRSGNRNLVNPGDFHAYVDLSDYSITGAVPVYLVIDEKVDALVSDVSHDPIVVHVNTENIIRRRFEVNANLSGNASNAHAIGGIEYSPSYIYVTGTSDDVGKIAEISFDVSVNGEREDVSGQEKLVLLGHDGKKVNSKTLSKIQVEPSEYVDYTVKIYKTKSLTVKASYSGVPAAGYSVDSIETSPTFISVYGPDDILNQTPYITIPRADIYIEGASENNTFNLDIRDYLPEGIKLNQDDSELVVLVKLRYDKQQAIPATVPYEPQPTKAAETSESPKEESELQTEVPEEETTSVTEEEKSTDEEEVFFEDVTFAEEQSTEPLEENYDEITETFETVETNEISEGE